MSAAENAVQAVKRKKVQHFRETCSVTASLLAGSKQRLMRHTHRSYTKGRGEFCVPLADNTRTEAVEKVRGAAECGKACSLQRCP